MDFIDLYLKYTEGTECPTIFHRWTAISSLGAFLGRRIFFKHGHSLIHPNHYVMLIGSPGTRKSSAIKIGTSLLREAGYTTFAARKTRQEKFLLDLVDKEYGEEKTGEGEGEGNSILERNLWGASETKGPTECFVAADEFNNFIGIGNIEFISILGDLWDFSGVFDYRLKNSKSVLIPDPTISILGGNTPSSFAKAFPPDIIGQGFFSRLILVYGGRTDVKITFPEPPSETLLKALLDYLLLIKHSIVGEILLEEEARTAIDHIYKNWRDMEDVRFEYYSNRRLTHLIKLCLVQAASSLQNKITLDNVIKSNTVLSYTESFMSKALGEFGKSKHADTVHKVIEIINSSELPATFQQIWRQVHTDLERQDQLVEILGSLQVAEKIQTVRSGKGTGGFLPLRRAVVVGDGVDVKKYINYSLLTTEEIAGKK